MKNPILKGSFADSLCSTKKQNNNNKQFEKHLFEKVKEIHLPILKHLPERQEPIGVPLEREMLADTVFEISFYLANTDTDRYYFGILSPASTSWHTRPGGHLAPKSHSYATQQGGHSRAPPPPLPQQAGTHSPNLDVSRTPSSGGQSDCAPGFYGTHLRQGHPSKLGRFC